MQDDDLFPIIYGSESIVMARSGLTDNDPGSMDLIRYALINANSIIYVYAEEHGYCKQLPDCDVILDEIANLLALASLELDREYFDDNQDNIKHSVYYKKAMELLSRYIIIHTTNTCGFTGVWTDTNISSNKCSGKHGVENDWWWNEV